MLHAPEEHEDKLYAALHTVVARTLRWVDRASGAMRISLYNGEYRDLEPDMQARAREDIEVFLTELLSNED
jgi:hypothetical protein